MPTSSLIKKAILWNAGIGALLCVIAMAILGFNAPLIIGSIVGLICSGVAMNLFFLSWRSAPDGAMVALFYIMRVALIFTSVIVAMFVSGIDALGVLLPQLPSVPVLAVLFLKEK